MAVKHAKVSAKSDPADTSLVRPSDWNADHSLTGNVATLDAAATSYGTNPGINQNGSGDRSAYVDFYSSASGYGLRILRNAGANGSTAISHYGTGSFVLDANGGNPLTFQIGGTSYVQVSASGNLVPVTDNSKTCGSSTNRWAAVWAANGTIQTSDARQKTDVEPSALGLDFILALRPVSYRWIDGGRTVEKVSHGFKDVVLSPARYDEDGNEIEPAHIERQEMFDVVEHSVPGRREHYGLIAQEVEQALNGRDFGGLVIDESGTYALRYDQFVSPLIRAVQELSAQVALLQAQVDALQAR